MCTHPQYLLRTANTDYFVVEPPTQDTDPRESALDPDRLFHWETAIRLALMPPDNADTGTAAGTEQNKMRVMSWLPPKDFTQTWICPSRSKLYHRVGLRV